MYTNTVQRLKTISYYLFLGLLAYVPFHIFLSTWLGSSLGVLEWAKVAKDVMLIVGFALALGVSYRHPTFKKLLKDKLLWLIWAYVLLHIVLVAIKPTDKDAELLGLVYNTRFLLFALYGALLQIHYPTLLKSAIKVVLVSGLAVAGLGILQYLFLPNDLLAHFGYSRTNGALPAFFIDDKPDLERIMSTVRDPNSLGSYLIIISLLLVNYIKDHANKRYAYVALAGVLLALFWTFSRSAWIGFVVAIFTYTFLQINLRLLFAKYKKFIVVGSGLGIIFLCGLFAFRNSYTVQNLIFHADSSTTLEDPNQLRSRFLNESLGRIASEPLGTGPGTAGLASIRNDKQGVTLNENYYLQIAEEVGVLGVVLFLAIVAIIAWRLWQRKNSPYAAVLLSILIGLSFTNLLVHIWSNESVAYTWWGLAGIVISMRSGRKTKTPRV